MSSGAPAPSAVMVMADFVHHSSCSLQLHTMSAFHASGAADNAVTLQSPVVSGSFQRLVFHFVQDDCMLFKAKFVAANSDGEYSTNFIVLSYWALVVQTLFLLTIMILQDVR
ncbi:hypothetical protein Pelo_18827 [Pelomyxa schiedti]|nr:hypothetical protein Pelo_18827 [Pelomyxa schiedti]